MANIGDILKAQIEVVIDPNAKVKLQKELDKMVGMASKKARAGMNGDVQNVQIMTTAYRDKFAQIKLNAILQKKTNEELLKDLNKLFKNEEKLTASSSARLAVMNKILSTQKKIVNSGGKIAGTDYTKVSGGPGGASISNDDWNRRALLEIARQAQKKEDIIRESNEKIKDINDRQADEALKSEETKRKRHYKLNQGWAIKDTENILKQHENEKDINDRQADEALKGANDKKQKLFKINQNWAIKDSELILKSHERAKDINDRQADMALEATTKAQAKRVTKIQEAEMKIRSIQEKTPDIWKSTNVQKAGADLTSAAALFNPRDQKTIDNYNRALGELGIQADKTSKALAGTNTNGKGFFKTLAADAVKAMQWSIVMGAIYGSLRLFKQGVTYVMELDNALNEIRIVTGMTQEQVEGLATSYGKLAEAMSVSTREIAKEAAELYRQGLAGQEVEDRMKAIIIYSKISGVTIAESDKIITASANATGRNVTDIINVFSQLGDLTAASASEIGEALQKVAATADNAGVSLEQASAMIATISSVTRESAQNIGNSLKSLMSRYSAIRSKGFNEEDATKLNDVTKALTAIGMQAVDTQGQLRPFTEILDELGSKWTTLTKNEQAYISTAMAGKHMCPTYRKL